MPVLIQNRQRAIRVDTKRLRRDLEIAMQVMSCPVAELSVSLVGERRMRDLNERYRGIDRVTDVLAFPCSVDPPRPAGAEEILGDVVVAPGAAARQAVERKHDLDREMLALCIHGLLHLLGYDHDASAIEAKRMRRQERRVLQSVGADRKS